MPEVPSSRAPRRALSTAAVVDAAVQLVDERGPAGLTLAAVAARTGVAAPSLYKHVPGLEGLHQLVSARATAELADALSRSVAGRSGHDALRALAHAYRDYAHGHPGRYPMTQRVPDAGDPLHVAAGALAVDTVIAALRGYGLPDDVVIDATRFVRSALHGFVSLEADGGFGLPQDVGRSFELLVEAVHVSVRELGSLGR